MYNGSSFFLGSNTPSGFKSYFSELYNAFDGWHAYILKGGPGTGKSGFMKKILSAAEKEGLAAEKIYCSSDPDSLDAVIFPEIKCSVADGTSPHVIEPRFPGVCEEIINLGKFWDSDLLEENSSAIIDLTAKCSQKHKRCVKFLEAAQGAQKDMSNLTTDAVEQEKLDRYISRLTSRKLGHPKGKIGKESHRYINAATMHGNMFFTQTVQSLCDDCIILTDRYGAVSPLLLEQIRLYALGNGFDIINCHNPLSDKEETLHLIIPEIRFGIFTKDDRLDINLTDAKKINAERFMDKSFIKDHRLRINFASKLCTELLDEAYKSLSEAKKIHDELEKHYIDAMDFDKVQTECEHITQKILNRRKK